MSAPVPVIPAADFAARWILEQSAALVALATGGVYVTSAPQDERRPRIAINEAGGERFRRIKADEQDTSRVGCETGLVQVDCLAPTIQEARRLALEAAKALEAFVGNVTLDGATFRVHWIEAEPGRQIPSVPQTGTSPTYGFTFDAELMLSQP